MNHTQRELTKTEQRFFTNPLKKELRTLRKYQKWETTKGYQLTDKQGRSMPSFVLVSSEVPTPCGAQCRVLSKGEGKVTATATSSDSRQTTQVTRVNLQKVHWWHQSRDTKRRTGRTPPRQTPRILWHPHQGKTVINPTSDRTTWSNSIIKGGDDVPNEGAETKRPNNMHQNTRKSRNYGQTRSNSRRRPQNTAQPS